MMMVSELTLWDAVRNPEELGEAIDLAVYQALVDLGDNIANFEWANMVLKKEELSLAA
jgi:hypothetical protein